MEFLNFKNTISKVSNHKYVIWMPFWKLWRGYPSWIKIQTKTITILFQCFLILKKWTTRNKLVGFLWPRYSWLAKVFLSVQNVRKCLPSKNYNEVSEYVKNFNHQIDFLKIVLFVQKTRILKYFIYVLTDCSNNDVNFDYMKLMEQTWPETCILRIYVYNTNTLFTKQEFFVYKKQV